MKSGLSRMTVTNFCSQVASTEEALMHCMDSCSHTLSNIRSKMAACSPLRERVRHARLAQPVNFFDLDTQHSNIQLSVDISPVKTGRALYMD